MSKLDEILKEYRYWHYQAGAKDKGDLPAFNEETKQQVKDLMLEICIEAWDTPGLSYNESLELMKKKLAEL